MRLYNTLRRRLDELPPPPGPIRMYFCGPTVYQRIHVGNARPFVISMWLRRWLERRGYDVVLAENVTDINDKIYEAAPGASAKLAADAARWYLEDTDDLGLGRPDVEPRATETVPEIVGAIDRLVEGGYAYEVEGDVYFRVARAPGYGALSGQRPEQVEEQEPNALKEDPRDFALWKATKEWEDTSWDSPWGAGRPGWHIECSVMAEKLLGVDFDVHGGGSDLLFPHHENEAAQTLAGRGKPLARLWMHNGMIELPRQGEAKMSKSVGNIVGLADALREIGRDTLIMFFAGGHYRKPIPYREDVLQDAAARVRRFREAGRRLVPGPSPEDLAVHRDRFFDALADDFNTPQALAEAHEWINEANRREGVGDAHLREMLGVLGLDTLLEAAGGPPDELLELARRRDEARAGRDFATADRLRDQIRAAGWEVRDGPSG